MKTSFVQPTHAPTYRSSVRAKVLCAGFAIAVLTAAMTAKPAQAAHSHGLDHAASNYRTAVAHFEDEAKHVRTVDRYTLRLVERLEYQTRRLQSVARRSDDLRAVIYEYNELESLHPRVQTAVFGSGCPIIESTLRSCWTAVEQGFAILSGEIAQLQSVAVGPHPYAPVPPPYADTVTRGYRGYGYDPADRLRDSRRTYQRGCSTGGASFGISVSRPPFVAPPLPPSPVSPGFGPRSLGASILHSLISSGFGPR